MAKKATNERMLHQMEFNLHSVQHLRKGLAADRIPGDGLVAMADAIIADYEAKIQKLRCQISSGNTG